MPIRHWTPLGCDEVLTYCSAGGGGKSEYRKSKIEAKNKKLFEERQRNAKEITKEKERRAHAEETGEDAFAGVHPSRRNRMA